MDSEWWLGVLVPERYWESPGPFDGIIMESDEVLIVYGESPNQYNPFFNLFSEVHMYQDVRRVHPQVTLPMPFNSTETRNVMSSFGVNYEMWEKYNRVFDSMAVDYPQVLCYTSTKEDPLAVVQGVFGETEQVRRNGGRYGARLMRFRVPWWAHQREAYDEYLKKAYNTDRLQTEGDGDLDFVGGSMKNLLFTRTPNIDSDTKNEVIEVSPSGSDTDSDPDDIRMEFVARRADTD
jgi:hypothetical protein